MDDDGSKSPIRTISDSDDDERLSNSGDDHIGDGNESSQSTEPMNNTLVFEEAFETQLVDLSGESETQVMDFDNETQVMNFGCETQEVEYRSDTQLLDDVEFIEDMETQLLYSFENEEDEYIDGQVSDSTEVFSNGDDLVRKGGCLFGETEEVEISSVSKEGEKVSVEQPENPGFSVITTTPAQDLVNPKHGFQPKKFTSVRSASLRASGLAAQNAAPKGSKSVSYTIPASNFREISMTESDSRNKSTSRESNVAARKLCYDGETDEVPDGTTEVGVGKVLTKFPASDLAGLSYIGSQEPGDLSQANALDFVDKFVKESMMEFDCKMDCGKSTGGKSKRLSSVKGEQKLAKKVSKKNVTGEHGGIYDWDDSREDEGGGDILRRINGDLSGSGSLGRRKASEPGIGIRMGLFNSDSKLLPRNREVVNTSEVRESKRVFGRNLINELNAETDIKGGEKVLDSDAPPVEVRFDTQMAAEVIEALSFGEGIDKTNLEESNSVKGMKQTPRGKRPCPNDENPATLQTRKSRRIEAIISSSSPIVVEKQGRNARKKSEHNDATLKSLQTRQNVVKMSNGNIGKKKGLPLKTSVKSLVPMTRRTRSSVELVARKTRRSGNVSDCGDDKHGLTGDIFASGKRSSGRGTWGSKVLTSNYVQVRKNETIKSDLSKEFDKVAALANKNEIDTFSIPIRRSTPISSRQGDKSDEIDDLPKPCVNQEMFKLGTRRRRSFREKRPVQRSHEVDFVSEEIVRGSAGLVESPPKEKSKLLDSPCATPVNCKIPVSDASPVCMGDEYLTKSRSRTETQMALLREIRNLSNTEPQSVSVSKDLRKRRDITDVRVLYSHHLDDDVIKHQKKILARLGVSVASSMADATHFIADHFVRTKNMLEAIAYGKPVVTHLWLDSCGQANCFIDEKHYILRDVKKEREFGFNMSKSLAFASQHPLLQGLRVFTTPNTKPGLDIISNLVKVVGGQAVKRVGRSAMKDGAFPDDLLVLSCEEDYAICVPFLEQGVTIYCSELLLNGIVSQKLEYDRYRLFTDHVKKTRSTMWLKKDGINFLPIMKSNQD